MKCLACKGEGLERLFFEEGDWHHDPTVPCEECSGRGEIKQRYNIQIYVMD
ncbi:hypothetical protein J36TS2_39050 [Bacillus paralicheniformis]|nr:hypothetical protein J36TS2_39050 [Bacillus paralicheniformis]